MYTIDDIKVTLVNKDEVKGFVKKHGEIARVCYDSNPNNPEKIGEHCMKSGHMSGSRANYFIFEVEAPRYTLDQMMRHSVGTMINCQSQRYVSMEEDFSIYATSKILKDEKLFVAFSIYESSCKAQYKIMKETLEEQGIKGEKANDVIRALLPIGVKGKVRMGFTLEALENFMHKRLCVRADLPIQRVATLMKKEVMEVEPRFESFLEPQCKALMYCPEGNGCGAYPSKREIEEIIKSYEDLKKDIE